MRTILFGLDKARKAESFNFAGFMWPKYVWTLPKSSFAKRIERHNNPGCGGYYHMPKPQGRNGGMGFYLESDGMPGLRWKWADDVSGSIRHTGWYCDKFGDTTIRGIVMALPHGRGFLAGWSMGENMASGLEYRIYDDEEEAARAADSIAESMAEEEREYCENEDYEE